MKICAFMPVFKRVDLVAETYSRLKGQTYPFDRIVAIGSCDEDREMALKFGVDYLHYENQPLSDKIQAGVFYLRQFNPDGIMGIGSDDWVTNNWVEELAPHLEKFEIVGADHLYLFLMKSNPTRLIRYFYSSPRYGEPMGAGRFISKRVLDKLDWKLYPPGLKNGLDGVSHGRMSLSGSKSFLYKKDDAKMLCPKGFGGQLTTWEHAIHPKRSKEVLDENWIDINFSGLKEKGLI